MRLWDSIDCYSTAVFKSEVVFDDASTASYSMLVSCTMLDSLVTHTFAPLASGRALERIVRWRSPLAVVRTRTVCNKLAIRIQYLFRPRYAAGRDRVLAAATDGTAILDPEWPESCATRRRTPLALR